MLPHLPLWLPLPGACSTRNHFIIALKKRKKEEDCGHVSTSKHLLFTSLFKLVCLELRKGREVALPVDKLMKTLGGGIFGSILVCRYVSFF